MIVTWFPVSVFHWLASNKTCARGLVGRTHQVRICALIIAGSLGGWRGSWLAALRCGVSAGNPGQHL